MAVRRYLSTKKSEIFPLLLFLQHHKEAFYFLMFHFFNLSIPACFSFFHQILSVVRNFFLVFLFSSQRNLDSGRGECSYGFGERNGWKRFG